MKHLVLTVIFWGYLSVLLSALERSPYVQPESPYRASDSQDSVSTAQTDLGNQSGISFNLQIGYMYGEVQKLLMGSGSYDVESQRIWKLKDTIIASASFGSGLGSEFL